MHKLNVPTINIITQPNLTQPSPRHWRPEKSQDNFDSRRLHMSSLAYAHAEALLSCEAHLIKWGRKIRVVSPGNWTIRWRTIKLKDVKGSLFMAFGTKRGLSVLTWKSLFWRVTNCRQSRSCNFRPLNFLRTRTSMMLTLNSKGNWCRYSWMPNKEAKWQSLTPTNSTRCS